jgi:hypothetical protein
MAKKMEENLKNDQNFSLDSDGINEPLELKEVPNNQRKPNKTSNIDPISDEKSHQTVNCLRNERIIVQHIPKGNGTITNPKHVLYGGMADNATRTFVVPKLSSGLFVNVLTDSEKDFLEEAMGLEYGALSVYKKVNNFWDSSNEAGISSVRLTKQDNYFDLSNPEDYIRYKILLANKNLIAPSLQALQDKPKATYQFVIIEEGSKTRQAKTNMSNTMRCYKEFGKVEDDKDILRTIIETIDGRPTDPNSKIEFLQTKANELIQADSKLFLKVITDPLLETKALIKKAIENGLISNRGNYLYLRSDNSPLCELNEEPTLNIAAKYLNSPKHQDILFSLQAKLK